MVQIHNFSLKIAHGHIEGAELRPQNLARLDIYLGARWSPIFRILGQQEVALKNEVAKSHIFQIGDV